MSNPYLDRSQPILATSGGNLPHWHQDGKLQFVTFRLADSLPQDKLLDLSKIKEKWLLEHPKPWDQNTTWQYHTEIEDHIDRWLDAGYGKCVLRNRDIAEIVSKTIEHQHGYQYILHDYVIMANHVHILVELQGDNQLTQILKLWKGISAREINKLMGKQGTVWFRESYDRLIRGPKHLENVHKYIDKNQRQGSIIRKRFDL